jgi:hypothetical protein
VGLNRRRGSAAEWDGSHRTVNPDSWSAAGSIPAVPTVGSGRRFCFVWRPEQRREVAQCGRASVSYSEGRGFEPRPNLSRAISSAEERPPHMREVGGSISPLPTRGSVAQADQSSRLLTGRLEVRVLSDPLRPVAQGEEQGFPKPRAAVRVCPGLQFVEGRTWLACRTVPKTVAGTTRFRVRSPILPPRDPEYGALV